MSGPFGSSQWMYASGGFYPYDIEQSLRFNDNDSSFLTWTPSTTGNRKTWTWSGWVKRADPSGDVSLFDQYSDGQNQSLLNIRSEVSGSDEGRFRFYSLTSNNFDTNVYWTPVFRDFSAWYHIVFVCDTTQATDSDRLKLYVNGVRITSVSSASWPSQNVDMRINLNAPHFIGQNGAGSQLSDAYKAELHFIDGQALDPTSFGEFKSDIWVPKEYTGTYGTNGFRLSFQNDIVSEGFNTVLYRGTGAAQSIGGVGFSPDLVWIKKRSNPDNNVLSDTVRGGTVVLVSDSTSGDIGSRAFTFNADGFSPTPFSGAENSSGDTFVAWCWDAGSGSPVSNTDGSITSTIKANPDYGFSVVSFVNASSTNEETVGHGLSTAPKLIISKNRDTSANNWAVFHSSVCDTTSKFLKLNTTDAVATFSTVWGAALPTSSVFGVTGGGIAAASVNVIAYCFAEVAGYSSIGSYTGTGASGNTINCGFKPAFVMVKRTNVSGDSWFIFDNTRETANPKDYWLAANLTNAETQTEFGDFTDTGFTINSTIGAFNASASTYIYMAFADTRDNAFWRDQSGNANDWQPVNLTYTDSLPDSPTNNFAVLNPILSTGSTFAEGNLRTTTASGPGNTSSTIGMSSGKWYAEFVMTANVTTGSAIGLTNADYYDRTQNMYEGTNRGIGYYSGGNYLADKTDGSARVISYGASWTIGDVMSVAYDADNAQITFYKNNVSQGTHTLDQAIETALFAVGEGEAGATATFFANFGQDSSFAGNKTAQGNTDANGVGDFYYAPPSGFLALCTANLPDPVIDPAQDDVPADYFNTVLWTGDGVSPRSISGWGFAPDFLWMKGRSTTPDHALIDRVRGTGASILSSNSSANVENDFGLTVNSFDADGFTGATGSLNFSYANQSGVTYVGWGWLAGNGTASNTDGSITSTVSVNQKAGFSIVSYTGNGTAGATIGHGLGAVPDVLLVKRRNVSNDWQVYHSANTSAPETDYLILNQTLATIDTAATWNDTAPTSSVFTVGNGTGVNNSSDTYISYCFAEVEGYSKFGSYTGNGSTDGPFVYCGFRPAWVMVKRTDTADSWQVWDATRDPNNVTAANLYPNLSNAEVTDTSQGIDMLSNGFKLRTTNVRLNASGGTYIFMAFAEQPAKYSNAR